MKDCLEVSHGLSQEMLWEIVARLPVQEILRARCVCRAWRDAIRDPLFIHKHRQVLEESEARGAEISTPLLIGGTSSRYDPLLLNPNGHDAWLSSPCFACPTSQFGTLAAAAGGLLCYETTNFDTDDELDFVVWNPITKECLKIPPLKRYCPISLPRVNMIVRGGRLRMLVVAMAISICVYDMFITKEAMETRIASSGKLIYPLPNLWMEFFVEPSGDRVPLHSGSSKLVCLYHPRDTLLDLNDFSVSVATRVPPAEFAGGDPNDETWYLGTYTLSESTGKLRVCWVRIDEYIVVCNLTFTHTRDAGLVSRHEPMFRILIPAPNFCIAGVPHDKLLFSELIEVKMEPEPDPNRCPPWEKYTTEAFVLSGLDALSSSGVASLEIDAVRVANPSRFHFPLHHLEPSLIDSPGALPRDFSWEMVEFPEESRELPNRWKEFWDAPLCVWC